MSRGKDTVIALIAQRKWKPFQLLKTDAVIKLYAFAKPINGVGRCNADDMIYLDSTTSTVRSLKADSIYSCPVHTQLVLSLQVRFTAHREVWL
jgi:hypothetical protein